MKKISNSTFIDNIIIKQLKDERKILKKDTYKKDMKIRNQINKLRKQNIIRIFNNLARLMKKDISFYDFKINIGWLASTNNELLECTDFETLEESLCNTEIFRDLMIQLFDTENVFYKDLPRIFIIKTRKPNSEDIHISIDIHYFLHYLRKIVYEKDKIKFDNFFYKNTPINKKVLRFFIFLDEELNFFKIFGPFFGKQSEEHSYLYDVRYQYNSNLIKAKILSINPETVKKLCENSIIFEEKWNQLFKLLYQKSQRLNFGKKARNNKFDNEYKKTDWR